MTEPVPPTADPAADRIETLVRDCTSLLTMPGLVCMDLMDIKVALEPVRGQPSRGYFGTGQVAGPDRARRAAEAALADLLGALRAAGMEAAPRANAADRASASAAE